MARTIINGSGRFNGAGAAVLSQSGIFDAVAPIVRNGAGDFTITMDELAQLPDSAGVFVSVIGAGGVSTFAHAVDRLSLTQFQVRFTLNAGAGGVATDTNFSVRVSGLQVG